MTELTFPVGGPLLADSPFYVKRDVDRTAAAHLKRMEYITLVEPRQSGKTSLINQLIAGFSGDGYTFAVRYLSPAMFSSGSQRDWYESLGHWILDQLNFIKPGERPKTPSDAGSWESFLAEIAKRAQSRNIRLAVVLDEVGALPPDLATAFFSVIRSVYSTRQNLTFYQHLTFIIAGAFDPRKLIRDTSVSDFNIDHRVHLGDFDPAQIGTLVSWLGLPAPLGEQVAARLHYWTGGQPYLCQWLCLYLQGSRTLINAANPDSLVDAGVASFFQEDFRHLSRIKGLQSQPALLAYVRELITEPRTRFSPGLNDAHFFLAHVVGIIKADSDSLCQVRNRIYERALNEMENSLMAFSPATDAPEISPMKGDGSNYDVFISYSHVDEAWVYDRLMPYLTSQGVSVFIDSRDFEVGVPILTNAERGLSVSRKVILVMTPNWVESEWTTFETLFIQTLHPGGEGRILPLMVQKCTVPGRLKIFSYLDFTRLDSFDEKASLLLAAIRKH